MALRNGPKYCRARLFSESELIEHDAPGANVLCQILFQSLEGLWYWLKSVNNDRGSDATPVHKLQRVFAPVTDVGTDVKNLANSVVPEAAKICENCLEEINLTIKRKIVGPFATCKKINFTSGAPYKAPKRSAWGKHSLDLYDVGLSGNWSDWILVLQSVA